MLVNAFFLPSIYIRFIKIVAFKSYSSIYSCDLKEASYRVARFLFSVLKARANSLASLREKVLYFSIIVNTIFILRSLNQLLAYLS
jgi:uncharacterized protein (DUF608 family)